MKAFHLIIPLFVGISFYSCGSKIGQTDVSGTFETTEILVSAQATGTILALNMEEGQVLKANQQIGFIDTIQLALKKKQLRASIQALKSRLPEIDVQMAVLQQQLSTAKSEQARLTKLVGANAAPQKQLDDVVAQIAVLQKQMTATKSTLKNGNDGADNEIVALNAQLEQIDDMLRKSYIKSPIDGTVLVKYAEVGELAVQGKTLFKVADISKMILRVYLTADQLAKLKVGQKVKVNAEFGLKENKSYNGTVSWISSNAEFTPKTIQTRDERANLVYAAKVLVPNDGNLKIGMYGGIYLETK